jgi:RNA polymerase subunit RPABC4/transcription elongation factor Spt4
MLLAVWDDGTWQPALAVVAVVLSAYLLVMWVGALVWTYRDIRARTRDQMTQVVAVLVVLVFNLPGILLYMVLRPKETLAELYDRRLGSEALLREIQEQDACPSCRRRIEEDFLACPYCRTTLRVPCESCGKALHTTWVLCPYCGAGRTTASPLGQPEGANETPNAVRREPAPRAATARRASTATYTPPAKPATSGPDAAADA